MSVTAFQDQQVFSTRGGVNSELFLISASEKEHSDHDILIPGIVTIVLLIGGLVAVIFLINRSIGDGDSSDDDAGGGRHYEDVGDDIVVRKRAGGAARRSVTGKKATHYPTLGDDRRTPPPPEPPSDQGVDQLVARYINESLEWKYSPCNDFYNFVCSKFSGPLADAISSQSHYLRAATKSMLLDLHIPGKKRRAVHKAAGLFQACHNLGLSDDNSEVRSLRSFLSQLGLDMSRMPPDPEFDIAERIVRLSLEYGFPTFVKFGYFKRPHIRNKMLYMQIYKPDERWIESNHQRLASVALARFYEDYVLLYKPRLDAQALVERIIRSEQVVRQTLQYVRLKQKTVRTHVDELGSFTEGYVSEDRWEELITHYTGDLFDASDTVVMWDNATAVVVLLLDTTRLARQDSRLLMAWSLLHRLLPFAHGKAMRAFTAREFVNHPDPIGDFCLQAVHGVMSLAITSHYFRMLVPPSALKSARRVVVNVRKTLMEKINNSNWIRDSVWCLMIGKAKAMRLITGYPKQFANNSLVEAFFAAFPRARNKFFTPYMKSHRLLTTRIFKEQATENFTLSSVNAYYLGSRNTITIYPGLLQPPFFFKGAPAAINYGGLGQVVGHEIMHAFDADGITYSYRYIRRNFDDTMTMKEYKKKLLCIRASYERAEASLSRARTSERDTDSEGFADFAGAVLAYATYRRLPEHVRTRSLPDVGLSAEQTFFVSRCLNLCSTTPGRRRTPGSKYWHSRSRCIVPLQNMPEFSKAFSCKPGDLMNPPDRCSFW